MAFYLVLLQLERWKHRQ